MRPFWIKVAWMRKGGVGIGSAVPSFCPFAELGGPGKVGRGANIFSSMLDMGKLASCRFDIVGVVSPSPLRSLTTIPGLSHTGTSLYVPVLLSLAPAFITP